MPDFDFAVQDGAFAVQDGAFAGELAIESFNDPIGGVENLDASQGPWRGSDSLVGTSSDSFRGPSCAERSNDVRIRKWSYPGDGLETYPELGSSAAAGSTIAMAVRPIDNFIGISFCHAPGHETDGYGCYWLTLDFDTYYDQLAFRRADSGGDIPFLTETGPAVPDDEWYILAVVLDGDGEGHHVGQLWATDVPSPGSGVRTTLEDEIVMDDTQHRGRGVGFVQVGTGNWDELQLGLP
ncbi:hypothetical protein [Halomarina oriensis]|uniref:Uncharacterized protein n=1 Tax=Halomarina oriensis TaxID=671145 RepID=A0A6B0GJN0_9EURY|nr:hypothetical protein [Halomarina oriensis]MWG34810.1 hypothetical protein [Halomarina oriensis]